MKRNRAKALIKEYESGDLLSFKMVQEIILKYLEQDDSISICRRKAYEQTGLCQAFIQYVYANSPMLQERQNFYSQKRIKSKKIN